MGAGLAGLRAASQLSAAGARVFVVEEAKEIGGKAALASRDGFAVDRSLQVLLFEDRRLLSWMQELEVGDSLLPLRSVHTAQLHAGRIVATGARGLAEIGDVAINDGGGGRNTERFKTRFLFQNTDPGF